MGQGTVGEFVVFKFLFWC